MIKSVLNKSVWAKWGVVLLAAALMATMVSSCGQQENSSDQSSDSSISISDSEPSIDSSIPAEPSDVPSENNSISTPEQSSEMVGANPYEKYDYSKSVPAGATVDNSYFDDAVFIGNSRTEGLKMYSGLSNATFITEVGLTVDSIFTDYCNISGGGKARAFDQLASMEFGKVYIMLGMNELGWVYESVFKEDYGKIIDKIREINPDATIYIQSIMPVSKWKDSTDDVYTIANVERLNAQLRDLADEKEVWYVDVAAGVMDEDGYLPYEATGDGVHLTPEYCVKWMDYLRTHTAQ